ncbi:ABC transporter-like protein [Pleomassaria siparia CBS 279.74]|uniref:ABC transporter-like protein n=1 Tax=Pleomassaria siparia CBS 279.74 TaxID=1314801 RepID=A0A6G1JY28_9PLEO|nr:ABC transporter-like protein [Pleomassaria siparia CBS 279.74]
MNIIFVYLFVGRFFLAYIAILGFRMCSLRISASIRLAYLEALFKQPVSVLDVLPPGQTAAIITITANTLQIGISERLSSLIQAITVIVTAWTIACYFSWKLTLVTSSGLVAIVVSYIIMTPMVVRRYLKVQESDRQASGIASDALSSIRMVAACGAEDKLAAGYNRLVEESATHGHKMSPMIALQHSPVFFTIYATFALCFWYSVKLYLNFEFWSIQTLIVVLMSVMTILAHISAVAVPLTAASHAINAAAIFFTIIDAPKPETGGIRDPEFLMNDDVVLKNINFAYPTRPDVKVLDALNLCFPIGKTTAIVGPSGSGKSTIVGLLQRWYQLDGDTGANAVTLYFRNGTIQTGGKNLHDIDLTWWRRNIGLVQQEPFLFNDTIFKNVEYGLVGTKWEDATAEVKKQRIEQACKEAYADEFITRLSEGYDTQVGDVGIKLSGGQRQRIAIARSIVRQPKILIFDEATSSLDVASERIVQAALDKVSQNRTTIVIAHRLSTIKNADKIVVLTKGRVVQEGTHESLFAEQGGAYWKLVNAQQLALEVEQPADRDPVEKSEGSSAIVELEKEALQTLVETEPRAKKSVAKFSKPRSLFRSFGMLLAEQKRNWLYYFIMLISAMGAGSSSALQAYLFARLFTGFAYWGEYLRTSTNFLCLMLLVVAAGIGLSYFALGWASNTVSVRTTTIYRKEYFRNIISKRISFFDGEESSIGMLTARLATDPTQLQQLLGINMAMVFISVFNVVACVTISFYFGWKFALVVICASMPIILASGYYRVRYEVEFEARNNQVFAESAKFATEAIRATRTVASLTLEDTICSRYQKLLQDHIKKSFQAARFSSLVFAASDSMVLLCMAFALWYGGRLMASYEYYPFNFFIIYIAIIQGSMAAGQWLSFGPNIAQVSAAANRIQSMRSKEHDHDIINSSSIITEFEENPVPGAVPPYKGADIELKNIWFQYPTRDTPVLQDLSISIQHGQFAAIVGPSGSGKTTIISLLERFYEPQEGSILYNSLEIKSFPLHQYRKSLSLVAQEPYLFRGTIRDNVLLGADAATTTEDVLHQACRDAGIHAFITSLPEGYDTDVGTGGVALSGGQKQRISIARALIRDPAVLLLDEATSSLDSETEKEVQEVFEQTGKGRTMIVVAHRLATVQKADVIFVMRDGRVVETGNHGRLLRARGVYWQMCQAQTLSVP